MKINLGIKEEKINYGDIIVVKNCNNGRDHYLVYNNTDDDPESPYGLLDLESYTTYDTYMDLDWVKVMCITAFGEIREIVKSNDILLSRSGK